MTLMEKLWSRELSMLSRIALRNYLIGGLCMFACVYLITSRRDLLFRRSQHYCECPTTDGQPELEQMTRSEVIVIRHTGSDEKLDVDFYKIGLICVHFHF